MQIAQSDDILDFLNFFLGAFVNMAGSFKPVESTWYIEVEVENEPKTKNKNVNKFNINKFNLGLTIQQARIQARKTQLELAKLCGCSLTDINNIEQGRLPPSFVHKLEEVLPTTSSCFEFD